MSKIVKYNFETIKNIPYSAIVFVPPPFFHQSSFFKITYIESGSAEVEFVSRKRKEYLTKKLSVGDAFIISPNDIHRYIVDESGEKYRHRDIYVDTELMKKSCDYISDELYSEIVDGEFPVFFNLSSNTIIALGEHLSVFINNKKQKKLDDIHKSLVISVLGMYCVYNSDKCLYPDWLQDLLRNLEKLDYIKQPIDEIVKQVGYSHSYVARIFKKYKKVSLKTYINDKKFEISKVMLLNTDNTLDDIAFSLCLGDASNYARSFKKKYGISAGKYRKSLREKQTSIPFVEWGGSELIEK